MQDQDFVLINTEVKLPDNLHRATVIGLETRDVWLCGRQGALNNCVTVNVGSNVNVWTCGGQCFRPGVHFIPSTDFMLNPDKDLYFPEQPLAV